MLAALLLVATLLYPQAKKSKKPKAPDAIIEQITVRRDGELIAIDGKLKNRSEKPIKGMVLLIQFLGPNKDSLTIQRGPVDSDVVAAGDEAEFRLQIKAPTRSVSVHLEAQDKDEKDLRIDNNGPFPIE